MFNCSCSFIKFSIKNFITINILQRLKQDNKTAHNGGSIEDKLINDNYLKTIQAQNPQKKFYMSDPDKISDREHNGYKIYYEEDKEAGVFCRLRNKSGQILIVKEGLEGGLEF